MSKMDAITSEMIDLLQLLQFIETTNVDLLTWDYCTWLWMRDPFDF
jgi:hypothetical protein